MARYRLLFLDVDGTLLTPRGQITDRTRSAIAKAKERGVRVSVATGRTYASAKPYADVIGADAPLILYNGARIQDPITGAVLREWRLLAGLARIALESVAGWDVHVSLFHDDGIFIGQWNDRARESAAKDGVGFFPVGDLATQLDRSPIKLMIIGDVPTIDRLEGHLREAYARLGVNGPAVVRTEPAYLEVWNKETSKGAAAAWVAEKVGVPLAEAIAFGDSLNDLDLIQSVGYGVAMENGHSDLKKAARVIAASNDEDGVARVLETLFNEP
jgi:Cof subfamily protein (haloacid dehalogenase superfamily)